MTDHIKRAEALKAANEWVNEACMAPVMRVSRLLDKLAKVPAADVAEVVHGRWIDGAEDFTCGNHNAECSICRCYVSWDGCDEDFNYCPNCGAKMDGGFDDATS